MEEGRVLLDTADVQGGVTLLRAHKGYVTFGLVAAVLDLEAKDLLVLFLGQGAEALVLMEEAGACRLKLRLVDLPVLLEGGENGRLLVQEFEGAFLRAVLEPHDTVGNAAGTDQSYPSHF